MGNGQISRGIDKSHTPGPEAVRRTDFLAAFLRDLRGAGPAAVQLVQADLKAKHRRAILGYLWLVLPGLAVAVAFSWLRQSELFVVRDTMIAYPLFVLSGMFLWQTFIEGVALPLRHMEQYRHILGCVRVPHEPVLLASLLKGALNALIRATLVGIFALYFGAGLGASFGTLVAFGGMLFVGWGLGLCILPIGLLYDDMDRLITVGSLLGIFACPIAFVIPAESVLAYNPLIPLFDAARASLNASFGMHDLVALGVASSVALFLALIGGCAYRLAQPHLVSVFR